MANMMMLMIDWYMDMRIYFVDKSALNPTDLTLIRSAHGKSSDSNVGFDRSRPGKETPKDSVTQVIFDLLPTLLAKGTYCVKVENNKEIRIPEGRVIDETVYCNFTP